MRTRVSDFRKLHLKALEELFQQVYGFMGLFPMGNRAATQTLREQKRQILLAHMSVGLVLFRRYKSYCATAISSNGPGITSR
jgi:hypothetical protein